MFQRKFPKLTFPLGLGKGFGKVGVEGGWVWLSDSTCWGWGAWHTPRSL